MLIKNVNNIAFFKAFFVIEYDSRSSISPLQLPHAAKQCRPFFLHEQFLPQGFFDVSLHLQRMNCSKSLGAAGWSVNIG